MHLGASTGARSQSEGDGSGGTGAVVQNRVADDNSVASQRSRNLSGDSSAGWARNRHSVNGGNSLARGGNSLARGGNHNVAGGDLRARAGNADIVARNKAMLMVVPLFAVILPDGLVALLLGLPFLVAVGLVPFLLALLEALLLVVLPFLVLVAPEFMLLSIEATVVVLLPFTITAAAIVLPVTVFFPAFGGFVVVRVAGAVGSHIRVEARATAFSEGLGRDTSDQE